MRAGDGAEGRLMANSGIRRVMARDKGTDSLNTF